MLQKFGNTMASWLQRWVPEPFVFAILLTLFISVTAILSTDAGLIGTLDSWYKGFWMLLEFATQAILLLATGYAIALSPFFSKAIDRLAGMVHTPEAVYLMVVIVGSLFSLISWGWVVLARELANRVQGLDYPYLVACVYLASQP